MSSPQTATTSTYNNDIKDDVLLVSKQGCHIPRLYTNRKCSRAREWLDNDN